MAKYTEFGLKVKIEMLKQDIETSDITKQLGITNQYFLDILKGARPGKKVVPLIVSILGLGEESQTA